MDLVAEETIEVMEVVTVMMIDQEIVTGVSIVNIQLINYFYLFLMEGFPYNIKTGFQNF